MRTTTQVIVAGILSIGVSQAIGGSEAQAQGAGPIGSLGGYGGSMTDTGSGMGMSGSGPVIPYAGRFGGFMPYRMGGTGSLSFPSRAASALGSNRTSFRLSPMTGGMTSRASMSGGTSAMPPMSGPRSMGVMPPSFAYPFRQPPSLLSPSSTSGMGMSN